MSHPPGCCQTNPSLLKSKFHNWNLNDYAQSYIMVQKRIREFVFLRKKFNVKVFIFEAKVNKKNNKIIILITTSNKLTKHWIVSRAYFHFTNSNSEFQAPE